MEINLRVVNRQTQILEREARLNLTDGGITIGRSPNNDLCLEDPERVISGSHARLDPREGSIWVMDTSRNGTYLNDAPDPLPAHQSVAMYDGDRLIIGSYEIILTLGAEAKPAAAISRDPFSDRASSEIAGSGMAGYGMSGDELPGLEKVGDATDILDLIDPGGSHGANAGKMPSGFSERNLADDPFADASPLDHDLAGLAASAPSQEAPHRHTPIEHVFYRPAEHQPVPDDYDLLNDAWAPPTADSASEPGPGPGPNLSKPSPATPIEPEPPGVETDRLDLTAPLFEEAPAVIPPPRQPEPPRPQSLRHREGSGGELEAFLAGLGIDHASEVQQPEEFLRHAGELLRALAGGLTQTMMGRAQFKSELRLGVTTIRAAENNPFKFSVATDDILDRLLFRPTTGFLPAVTAAREAFDDIQAHEMAMTAGLQAALRALFARFEPNELERRLSRRSGLDQVLPMARKAKYWDLFTEIYEQVAADAAEDFMQLFGDAFAHAYQEQIRRLREARGTQRS